MSDSPTPPTSPVSLPVDPIRSYEIGPNTLYLKPIETIGGEDPKGLVALTLADGRVTKVNIGTDLLNKLRIPYRPEKPKEQVRETQHADFQNAQGIQYRAATGLSHNKLYKITVEDGSTKEVVYLDTNEGDQAPRMSFAYFANPNIKDRTAVVIKMSVSANSVESNQNDTTELRIKPHITPRREFFSRQDKKKRHEQYSTMIEALISAYSHK